MPDHILIKSKNEYGWLAYTLNFFLPQVKVLALYNLPNCTVINSSPEHAACFFIVFSINWLFLNSSFEIFINFNIALLAYFVLIIAPSIFKVHPVNEHPWQCNGRQMSLFGDTEILCPSLSYLPIRGCYTFSPCCRIATVCLISFIFWVNSKPQKTISNP